MKDFYNLLLLCLFPIALYCVALAMTNRRLQPSLVPGALDFLSLLFAASGLLLFAGPKILNELFEKVVGNVFLEENGTAHTASNRLHTLRWIAWGGYYAIVVSGAAFLIWLRRNRTIVYNISPAEFDRALTQALARLHVSVTHEGKRRYLGFGGSPAAQPVAEPQLTAVSATPLEAVPEPAAPPPRLATGDAVVDVEPFEALWNVTLHWRNHSGTLRQEVEEELSKELREVCTYDNPVGSWFLGVAGFLFALIFMILMVLILAPFLQPRG